MILALLAIAVADPVLDAVRVEPAVQVLPNGLTVAVMTDPWTSVVSASIRYGVGAAEDPSGATGTAHLLEHLMFEGSANAPDGRYDTLLAAAGGTNNAWTDHDWTVYTAQVPPEALDLLLFLESDRMAWLGQGLDPDDFTNQQDVVHTERVGDQEDDLAWSGYGLSAALWPADHPYYRPVLGTLDDLANANPQRILTWHQAWYRPSNAFLVLVGDLDPTETFARVERAFADVPAGGPTPPRVGSEVGPLEGEQRRLLREHMSRERLYVGWRTVPHGHPDEPALDVLSGVLSGGRGTPLDDALFFQTNLVTSIGSWTRNARLGGEFVIYAAAQGRPLEGILDEIDSTLERVLTQGVTQEQIDRVIAGLRSAHARGIEDRAGLADHLGDCLASHGDPSCRYTELEALMAVTPDDVQRVARSWLGEGRVVLSVVSPGDEHLAVPESTEVVPP